MKKRILSALMAMAIGLTSFSAVNAETKGKLVLSDTTTVNVENTDTCFAKPTDEEYHAKTNNYMHFKSTGDWLEVTQNLTETAVAGGQYVVTVIAKPVSGRVWFRVGWDDTAWMVVEQSDAVESFGDGWYKYVKEITMTADQTNLLFHNDSDMGVAEFYIDGVSLKPMGEEKELLPNGEFDTNEYTVNVQNTDTVFAEVLSEEIVSENEYSLHFKAPAADWLEVTQNLTETAVAGGSYILSAYVKPVSGRVWFRLGWDHTAWMVADASVGTDWVKVEKEVTMTDDQTFILIHNDQGMGDAEFYIDDISLKAVGSDVELIPDGSFEEVKLTSCPGEHVWDEGVVTKEPTIDEEGIRTHTCTVCIQTKDEPIEKLEDIDDELLVLSNTTTVNVENTDTCFAKVTDNTKNSGKYGLHIKATGADWLEVSQRLIENALVGEKYILSAYVKPVEGRVWFRLGWDNDAWLAADASLGTEWVKVTKEVTVAGNEGDLNTILFHGDGATEFYIDDLSLVKVGTETELVPDGGFEDVTVEGEPGTPDEPTVDIPDEDLILSETTRINADAENCYAKVTDNERNSENYSLHFYTEGDWLEIAQNYTEPLTAGTYTLTWYAKGEGRIWFYSNWGTEFAATHSVDSAEVQANGWTKYTRTLNIDGDGDVSFLFHGEGAVNQYIDDISLVDANGVNYIIDGGFEEVTVFEELVMPEKSGEFVFNSTRVNANADNCYAEPTNAVKHSGEYSMHLYTEGDWLEIGQDYTAPLTAGTYTLTWYAVGEGTIWFYSNWGTEFAATQAVDSAEVQADGWTKYTRTLNIDGEGDTSFLFHTDGSVNVCIDDISLVDANGVNYIADGGFEDIKPVCCTGEHIWDEGVVTLEPTEEAEGIRTYSCTVCTQTKTEAIEKLPVVPEYRLGDTNGDGEISVKDVVPIRRSIAGGYTVEMNEAAADVNQDGTISVKDVVPIRRFIAGGYGVEL